MRVFKHLGDVAKGLGVKDWEVQKQFEKYFLRSTYMPVGEVTVYFHSGDTGLNYVVFDKNDNEDCKKYMMEYELDNYDWEVKTDDIVGIEKCKVIDITNTKRGIDRATVITESGTQLNRRVVFISDKEDEDYKNDGCIYFFDKE